MVKFRLLNAKGFSLTEVLMALGVLAMVSLGVGVAVSSLFTQQQQIVTSDTGDNFSAAFFQHLLMQNNCNAAISGRSLPSGTGEVALNVQTFRGMGESASNTVHAGAQVDRGLFVNQIVLRRKPGTSSQRIQIGPEKPGNAHLKDRYVLQIALRLERRLPNETPRPFPERILEIPVLTTAGSSQMEACQMDADTEDACLMTGGTVNANGTCSPASQCTMQGTFIKTTCEGGDSTTPCNPEYQGGDRINKFTGLEECPAGSCPSKSGQFKITRSIQTGKKTSTTIQVYENFYICMSCPGTTCTGKITDTPAPTKKD